MKNNEIERPDLYLYEQAEEDEYFDFAALYEPETQPCQCCGAEITGDICPVCSWEQDEDTDLYMPSEQNNGLSLYEAKLNFGAFGNAYPPVLWEK